MSLNSPVSFFSKKSGKSEDADDLKFKTKYQLKTKNFENVTECHEKHDKSLSESTPVLSQLLCDLKNNYIFKQQREKNRRSKSIDFFISNHTSSSKTHEQNSEHEDGHVHTFSHLQNQRKSLSATNIQEVLKTLQLNRYDAGTQYYAPQKFPLTTDDTDGINFRKNSPARYRLSKTTDFGTKAAGSAFPYHDFEVRGCGKIVLPNDNIYKLKKNEIIRCWNGDFYKCSEKREPDLIYGNVANLKSRLSNKREVELKDDNNSIFVLTFDSSKDAKFFLETVKLSPYVTDEKSSVKKTLFRLLGKRSSREVLEKKGIYQNEPIFGNTLKNIYNTERGVPRFIVKAIELIERPENIKSVGIYRTSGNLAVIQKIRFEVDKGNLDILDDYSKDVDVLTGSLKLFFRELKEPLIPCSACDQLLGLTRVDKLYTKDVKEKIRSALTNLPTANWETLRLLLRHLIEVAKHRDENKMDPYNLSVCWGPTVNFATEAITSSNRKDLVTQSTEATRMFENLLLFYINNPEELGSDSRKQNSLDRNRNLIFRQDSKDSIQSSDSTTSKGTTKRSIGSSGSNLYLEVDETVAKLVEMIEPKLNAEGIYKKTGVSDKVSKLNKKILKKKWAEMDKYKNDVIEIGTCLKSYIQSQEPLITRQSIEHIMKLCDNTHYLETNTRHKIMSVLNDLPKKDTFTFLLKHILLVIEHEQFHKVPRSEMISIWTNILNHKYIIESDEKFVNFLKIVLDVLDDNKMDFMMPALGMNNGLLNDLKNLHKERDRTSKYDNVPDDSEIRQEFGILERKTDLEHTKL